MTMTMAEACVALDEMSDCLTQLAVCRDFPELEIAYSSAMHRLRAIYLAKYDGFKAAGLDSQSESVAGRI